MRINKRLATLVLALVFLLVYTTSGAAASDVIFSEKKVEPVAPGITYESIWEFTPAGWLRIHLIRADLTRSYVQADLLLSAGGLATGEHLSQMAQRTGAVAAINGDFFFGRGFGTPIGPVVKDGELLSSPSGRRDLASFGLRRDGTSFLGYWTFQGSVVAGDGSSFPLAGYNKPGESYQKLYAYDSHWGKTTPSGITQGSLAAVVSGGQVVSLGPADGGVPIPAGSTILVGAGPAAEFLRTHLPVGSRVEIKMSTTPAWQDLAWALGGGTVLVENGRIVPFTHEVKGTSPRSAVAVTRDGRELLLVAVDGRQEESRGLTQAEWAGLLLKLGAYQALNLDGGGSTTVLARLPGETHAGLVNRPSEGSERSVGNGIGLFSSAPRGDLAGLVLAADDTNVPLKGRRTITVKGFDAAYNPVPVDNSKVRWSVEPASLGTIKDGVFLARASGQGKIKARLGPASGELSIRVIGPPYRLEPAPGQLALAPGQEATLKVYARDAQGFRALLDPADVSWRVLGEVGTFAGGKFKGAAKAASGALEARFGGLAARVLVSVGENEKPLLYFELLRGLSFAAYPAGVKGGVALATFPEPFHGHNHSLRLDYDFTAGSGTRAAYVVFEPGLALPALAEKLALWVYGDGQEHWLRALVADKSGREFPVDLARRVDWNGWERVEGLLPSGGGPYTLKRIYLVEPDPSKRDAGRIYLDDLTVVTAIPFKKELAFPVRPLPDPHYTKAVPSGQRFLVAGALPAAPEGVEWLTSLKEAVKKYKAAFVVSLTPLAEKERAAWEKALGVPVKSTGASQRWDAGTASFYTLKAAGGTLVQNGAAEWRWLQADLAQLKGKRQVFVFLDRYPFAGVEGGFASRPEAELLRRRLRESGERLKALVWTFSPGVSSESTWEDGVRYQRLGAAATPGEPPRMVLVSISGGKVSYTGLKL
ncbi:MAG: hypothetical protein PWQ41_485 [Bacillota bacterium]|nr:hypothetical protein [Bacillota bacterium]MDK2924711.1 hypothetical protein [Bacillota bacterium]